MEVKVKPKIFVHSWLSDDLLLRLEKNFNMMFGMLPTLKEKA